MSEETNSNTTIKIEPIEYSRVKQDLDDYENTTSICMENDEICLQQFLKSEVTVDEDIKQERIDEQDFQVKQEFDDYECTSHMSMENDEICLQQFLKSEVPIDEEMKQEKINGHDAATNTSLDEKSYIFIEEISNLSNFSDNHQTKASLNEHKAIIFTKKGPYKCKVCNKTFTFSGNLSEHKKVHSGERPYSCEMCHKTFATKRYLKQHEVVHTKERHECE
ncbi:zinc finger protein 570-like, partial [Ctenocephalides felis]|uniref:zinc finger protein 570-like n=1 Tax=Ctenocephalides felis TaxID=7515 RepID=UPI000E6E34F2